MANRILSAFLSLLLPSILFASPIPPAPNLNVKAYVLMDFDSKMILASSNEDLMLPPASITKMMTAYVAFTELKEKNISMDEEILVSEKAWKTGGSKMFIEVGKKVKVRDILQGVITVSGNDASVALAEHISGDEKTFTTYMNQMATNLGLTNTNYSNSTGLPNDSLYTTAKDISLLSRALISEFPKLYELYSTKSFQFNEIYNWVEENLDDECIEYIVSLMMEPYEKIITPLIRKMSSDEDKYFNIPTNRTVQELRSIIEKKYSNILSINFEKKQNYKKFWFISKNKEEPRIADRFEEEGSELEQPLAIARDIKKLYEKLLVSKNSMRIDKFLMDNSELRHVVRRAFIIEKFPYSEIQDNTISESTIPIDMLRLKLSFFGALKFDPRSDKWLRICMFQGAPLPNELKNYDDQWVYKTH